MGEGGVKPSLKIFFGNDIKEMGKLFGKFEKIQFE
jgi:hypothetical protein